MEERVIIALVYLVASVLFLRVVIPPEGAEKAVLVSRLPALTAWAVASVAMVLAIA